MSMSYEWVGIAATVTMALLFVGAHLWPAFSAGLSGPRPGRRRRVLPASDPSLELTGRQLRKQAEVEWKREFELLMEGEPCTGCAEDWFEKLLNSPTFHLQFEAEYEPSDPIACPRHGHRLQSWW